MAMAMDKETAKKFRSLEIKLESAQKRLKELERENQSLRDRNAALSGDTITIEEHTKFVSEVRAAHELTNTAYEVAKKALRGLGAEYHPAEGDRAAFYSIKGLAPGSFAQEYETRQAQIDGFRETVSEQAAKISKLTAEKKAAEARVKELESMDMDSKKLRARLQKKEGEVQAANTEANKLKQEMGRYIKERDAANREAHYARYTIDQVRRVKRDDAVTHAAVAFKPFAMWLMKEKGMTREEAGVFVERSTIAYYGSIDLSVATVLDGAEKEVEEMRKDDAYADEVRAKIASGEITLAEGMDFRIVRLKDGTREHRVFKAPVKVEQAPATAKAS